MNHLKKTILFALLFSLALPTALAQNTSTQGKEFWLSFMHNGFYDHINGGWDITQVLISAKRDCEGTISNPLTGWSENFSVSANNTTIIDIPIEQGYHNGNQFESITQKAIKVESTDTISVYCTNIAYVSFDASFVLPVESLGDEYILQSHDQSTDDYTANYYVISNQTSAFVIVATEDNTDIAITPTCETMAGHMANQTFHVMMNAGETYHVRSTRSGSNRDLSGTHILASDCKKIAVFNGNTLTCIPINMGNGYDLVFEQAMPLRSWGKNFVVTSSRNRNRDFIKITSSANNNLITMNGDSLTTLRANQSYTFYMMESEGSCYLEATQPSAVYLYNNSSYDQNPEGGLGDPSMVWIAPVEQRIDEVTFSTFDHENIGINVHSVNIIVNSEDINNVYFDGSLISPLTFSPVNGNNRYSYTRMDISHGVHHIACENGFNAHVYGFGQAKGYAYLVGSNASDLSTNVSINEIAVMPNDNFQYCIDNTMTFSADVNFTEYDLHWDFGDGTTSTDNPVTHVFHDKQVYPVALTVSTNASGCAATASDTTYFYVDLTQQYFTESDETCAGELYSGYGFNNILINNDTILGRQQVNPIFPECYDSLLVYITAFPQYHIPISDSRCWQGEPGVYDDYGFSFSYDQPGEYDRQLNLENMYGCDSIINLHLTVRTFEHTSFDTITCGIFNWNGVEYNTSGTYTQTFEAHNGCDSIVDCHLIHSGSVEGTTLNISDCNSYFWLDSEYTVSGSYEKTLSTTLGCDSIVHLNLDLGYTPDPTPIYPKDPENTVPHWVITATEFQINSYEFYFWDNNANCHWDSIVWKFDNPDLGWVLEPDSLSNPVGITCKMYVLEHVDDTIWLSAKVYNDCAPQGIERRYWFVCSFYDVDEHQSQADFSVVPNPNNGLMTLNFNHFTGPLEVKVYDMKGTLVDRFQTTEEADSHSMTYHAKTDSPGVYFFVVTGRNGTVAKKVIQTP